MNTARFAAAYAKLIDGRVLIAGGQTDATFTTVDTAELYDPATNQFEPLSSHLTLAVHSASALTLSNGKVLLVGGHTGASPSTVRHLFDPTTKTFSATSSCVTEAGAAVACPRRLYHSMTRMTNGRVLIVGGTPTNFASDTAEIYNPATDQFIQLTATMPQSRTNHFAGLRSDGKVVIAGGLVTAGFTPSNSVLSFDPATNLFTAESNISSARWSYGYTQLEIGLLDGRFFLVGGYSAATTASNISIPEVVNGSGVSNILSCSGCVARGANSWIQLVDGRILNMGGETSTFSVLQSAEIYNLRTLTGSSGYTMVTPRSFMHPVLLNSGKVLIMGGLSASGVPLKGTEIFE